MNGRKERVEAIFQVAMELSLPQDRDAYLQRECGQDAELRREVEELLRAAVEAEEVFETSVSRVALEQVGSRIGHYHLLQKIGEGGCGVVYMAEQEAPVRRKVALKIVKLGMDTRQVIARFEAERQALALMDHPNIAKVLDAGATDTGRPYFVMELVRGRKITQYCDEQRFSTSQRLELFIQVCQAVQHAHQKGIIHRDLKPSNILVTERDGVPVPKVIDFGIAKATGGLQLTDKTLFTAFEQFMGTPAYMSPEQVRLGEIDIDTRSDVYSLGVLLYELLTGKTPFDSRALLNAGFEEIRRIIREVEPPKPSTRVSTTQGQELAVLANLRRADPRKLGMLIRGDLDWIVMKALEKDRTRRYETANGLAADIGRFLRNDPVTAVAPSAAYRLRKFVQRNLAPVVAAATILILLIGGITASTWLALVASRARNDTDRANLNLKQQMVETEAARRATEDGLETMKIQKAEEFFAAGDSSTALAYLAWVVQRNPLNRVATERLLSALTHGNIALPAFESFSHTGKINSFLFSSDGQRVATVSADRTARVWDAHTGRLLASIAHDQEVSLARFNQDGHRIVTCSSNVARVWDADTGSPVTGLLQHKFPVMSVDFSPDGQRIVTGSLEIIIWDARTGQELVGPFGEADLGVGIAMFSPEGQRVVTGSANEFRLWDATKGTPLTGVLKHEIDLSALMLGRYTVDFDPSGKRLVTVSPSKTAVIWDVAKEQPAMEPLKHPALVLDAKFSPDGRAIITACEDKTARLWDALTGKPLLEPLSHQSEVGSARFSSDGEKIFTTTYDQNVRLWDTRSGEPLTDPIKPRGFISQAMLGARIGSPVPAQLNQNGEQALVLSSETTAQMYDTRPGHSLDLVFRHEAHVFAWHVSADSARLIWITSSGDTARIWDSQTGKPLAALLKHNLPISSAGFSPDGRRIITTSLDYTARIWDTETGEARGAPLKHDGLVFDGEFNPRRPGVLTTGTNLVTLWNLSADPPSSVVLKHGPGRSFPRAHFSPDGQTVVTTCLDKMVRVWNASSGQLITTITLEAAEAFAEFSPDSLRILTAGNDGTVRVWDARTGAARAGPFRHAAEISAAHFSPNGKWLLTASADGTARVWDAQTDQPVTEPIRHGTGINSAEFSPDGVRFATASQDTTVRVWDAKTGQPLSEPLRHGGPVRSMQFTPDGQQLVTISAEEVRILELMPAVGPAPGWLSQLAEAIAGQHFHGTVPEAVPTSEFLKLKDQLLGSSQTNSYNRWARWLLADRSDRSISPFASMRITDYVHRLIQENTTESLEAAVKSSPTNALALARLARLILQDESPLDARGRLRAEQLIGRAKGQSPNEPEVFWAEAELLRTMGKMPEALGAMDRASDLEPADPDFWLAKGIFFQTTNQLTEALSAYTQAIHLTDPSPDSSSETRTRALLKRSSLLKKLNRPTEAQADLNAYLQAKTIPLRDPNANPNLVDLSPYYTTPISTKRGLASVPLGVQHMSGVDFDIRSLVEIGQLALLSGVRKIPTQVKDISMDRVARRLYFLHAADNVLSETDGTEVGHYTIHYADGEERTIPIVFGKDLAAYSAPRDEQNQKLVVAWTGVSETVPNRRQTIRLFKTTWENPRPDVAIGNIDFVSTKQPVVLLLLALTIE